MRELSAEGAVPNHGGGTPAIATAADEEDMEVVDQVTADITFEFGGLFFIKYHLQIKEAMGVLH